MSSQDEDDGGLRCQCRKRVGDNLYGLYKTTCPRCGKHIVIIRAGRASLRLGNGQTIRVVATVDVDDDERE